MSSDRSGRPGASAGGIWLRGVTAFALLQLACPLAGAQQLEEPLRSSAASQAPKTAPATEAILGSYEGQNVTGIQIAGQPNSETRDYASLFVQHEGEPFSVHKVQQTIAALKVLLSELSGVVFQSYLAYSRIFSETQRDEFLNVTTAVTIRIYNLVIVINYD